MTDLSARFRAVLWWLLPLAALLVLLGWETDWGRAVEPLPQPAAATVPAPTVASLLPEFAIAGGIAARTETIQRTLFNPTRRPAPPAPQDGGVGRLQRGQFALTGTTLVDGKNTAFLREVAGNRSRRVQAGEKINGLLVAEVRPDRVKLTLGDETEELVLRVATNPRPTAAPVAAGPASPVPVAAAPGAIAPALADQAMSGAAQDAAQTLAERRRAARAAQVAAGGAASPPAGTAVAAPMTSAVPAAATSAAQSQAIDPRWEQMDQRYRERAASRPTQQ